MEEMITRGEVKPADQRQNNTVRCAADWVLLALSAARPLSNRHTVPDLPLQCSHHPCVTPGAALRLCSAVTPRPWKGIQDKTHPYKCLLKETLFV